jgi:hypothetical protein
MLLVVSITSLIKSSSLIMLTFTRAVPIFLSDPLLITGLGSYNREKLGVYVSRVCSSAMDFLRLLFRGEYRLRVLLSKKSAGSFELFTLIFFLSTMLWLRPL